MEASEHRPAHFAEPVNWLSPSLIVSLSLALLAAALTGVYLLQRGPAPVSAPSVAAALPRPIDPQAFLHVDPATGQEIVQEVVEMRCVEGMRVRKQGSSYSQAGHC